MQPTDKRERERERYLREYLITFHRLLLETGLKFTGSISYFPSLSLFFSLFPLAYRLSRSIEYRSVSWMRLKTIRSYVTAECTTRSYRRDLERNHRVCNLVKYEFQPCLFSPLPLHRYVSINANVFDGKSLLPVSILTIFLHNGEG